MLRYAVGFFIMMLIAALFALADIVTGAAEIARIPFSMFILLLLVSHVMGLMRRK